MKYTLSAVAGRQQVLGSCLYPAYRPSALDRGKRNQYHIRIIRDLASKTTSDIHCYETHLVVGKSKCAVELRQHEGRLLIVTPKGQKIVLTIVICDRGVRL